MADERFRFWKDSGRWPRDTTEYVFLCRCVAIVGHYLFGDEWTGGEPFAPAPYNFWWQPGGNLLPLPQALASHHQKGLLRDLLAWRRPDLGIALPRIGFDGSKKVPDLTEQQWSLGLEEAEKLDAMYAPALERFQQAQAFIVSALAEGKLKAALRPIAGGAFSAPIAAHLWNTEDLSSRFYWGQMNPSDPFSGGVGGDAYQYIYVERRSLEFLINAMDGAEEAVAAAPSGIPSGHFDGIAIGRSPMELPVWSFGIAVAWIMCRSPGVASEYWTGPLDVAMAYTAPGAAMSFEAAQAELVHRLASGSLKATATDAQGDIQELGAHEWRHLTPQPDGGNNGLKIRLWRPGGDLGGTTYHDVRLMRDDVLDTWPEIGDDEATTLAQPSAESGATANEGKQKGDTAPAPRPAATATIKKAITSCATFAAGRGITPLNREEFVGIFMDIFTGTTRQKIREAFNDPEISPLLPEKKGPQGPRNPNRNNEIEEFRRFLSAAELRY